MDQIGQNGQIVKILEQQTQGFAGPILCEFDLREGLILVMGWCHNIYSGHDTSKLKVYSDCFSSISV